MTIIRDDLVSYWEFEESSGDAVDSHGSNDLTPSGVSYEATGKNGDCFSYDGSNDYAKITSLSLNLSGFSYGGWIKWDGSTARNRTIFYFNADHMSSYIRPASSSKLATTITTSAGLSSIYSNSAISSGSWVHFIITWDGSTITMYINGSAQTNTASRGGTFNYTGDFAIGRNEFGDTNWFDGDIDEILIANRAFTSTEVSWLYNGGTGRFYDDIPSGTVVDEPALFMGCNF